MLQFSGLCKEITEAVSNVSENITIFTPYVKLEAIQRILEASPVNVKISLVTRSIASDFAMGVSDLSALELLLKNGHFVFTNNRIHLKTYLYDFKSLHTGSANCTNKGLGLARFSNYETLAFYQSIEISYLKYLDSIIGMSTIIELPDIGILKKKVDVLMSEKIELSKLEKLQEELADLEFDSATFFASQLPRSRSVKGLYLFISSNQQKDDYYDEYLHDLMVFKLDNCNIDNYESFKLVVLDRLMNQNFMKRLFCSFEDSANFGYIRKFFEAHCIDNPRPAREEVNLLINNVFSWLEELSGSDYEILQPNHTKIIRKKDRSLK